MTGSTICGLVLIMSLSISVAQSAKKDSIEAENETVKTPLLKNVYFGEHHLHTRNSFDAFTVGVTQAWEDAYRFAMGDEIKLSTTGEKIKRRTSYDFIAITDHSEYLGVLKDLVDPKNPLSHSDFAYSLSKMRTDPEAAKDLVTLTPPTEKELLAYFNKHQQRYQEPERYTFTQIFINPDKRKDAEKIKAKLIAQGDAMENVGALGDSFMLQNYYPEKERIEIQKLFGTGFTEALSKLSTGQWHGPVLSGYGVHLVYVSAISIPPSPIFAEVRERVMQDWETEKGEELYEKFYVNLRNQYTVVIEDPDEDNPITVMEEQAL